MVGHSGISLNIDLYDWDICGRDILYLYLQAPIYFIIVVIADAVLQYPAIAMRIHRDPEATQPSYVEDEDVAAEEARVARVAGPQAEDVVSLRRLRKVYPSTRGPKVAVRDLSFGMPRGECFGFLGINGAGKTSTLNMLTGAVLPSAGDAWLGGKHILTEQQAVRAPTCCNSLAVAPVEVRWPKIVTPRALSGMCATRRRRCGDLSATARSTTRCWTC